MSPRALGCSKPGVAMRSERVERHRPPHPHWVNALELFDSALRAIADGGAADEIVVLHPGAVLEEGHHGLGFDRHGVRRPSALRRVEIDTRCFAWSEGFVEPACAP